LQRAKEQAEQRKQAEVMFSMAQRAYGKGVYDKSVELLEAALTNVPGSSILGGEVNVHAFEIALLVGMHSLFASS
jgi:hypothetical protein